MTCQIDWHEVGVAFELQCLRNCTLSRCSLIFDLDLLNMYHVLHYAQDSCTKFKLSQAIPSRNETIIRLIRHVTL